MDWQDCLRKQEAKQIKPDTEMAKSLQETSANKSISSKELKLRPETAAAKISLSYDAVRELLESLSLKNGFKIYNHICYTVFLKEILKQSDIAEEFNELRKIRNDINYYGKSVSLEEARHILNRLDALLGKLRKIP